MVHAIDTRAGSQSSAVGKDMALASHQQPSAASYSSQIAPTNEYAGRTSRSSESQRLSSEQAAYENGAGNWPTMNGAANGHANGHTNGKDTGGLSVPNGVNGTEKAQSAKSATLSMRSRRSSATIGNEYADRRSSEVVKDGAARPGVAEEGYFGIAPGAPVTSKPAGPPRSPLSKPVTYANGDASNRTSTHGASSVTNLTPVKETSPTPTSGTFEGMLKPPSAPHHHRASSPPAFHPNGAPPPTHLTPQPGRLVHRHTLEVPKVITRTSKDGGDPTTDGAVATGRFSPNTPTKRRGSLQLARRHTRSIASDVHLDDYPQDEDAARWAEHIKAKRAKKHRVDTDDERVVVGTKVDEHHVNWVTAYNMLTGIRFCVSRTNAKLDRELEDADFVAKHKFSFDITGNELTPSAKYDFKFKDYAPWVFRHLRASFKIDPAEYLMSLTSKYILSELGSPGKSGSFFYFSRDYKYIIKTIHHGEHKFLRKILKDYYMHVQENPNTLLSQFYGLHRVKIPYGRKIHFVVMNNLFPPHRDIHRTFDLKGSTIGRDFKEEELVKNPRATLKDLNWLRRNLHLEFGPTKKSAFVEQMQKDVALLQRLKIMDYSLLVGIHDLERGNEENLRDKTLQVFQPGGAKQDDVVAQRHHHQHLARTPSKMETAQRARELRDLVKKERPVPMDQTIDKMPEGPHRDGFYFYADDGGFQATHEDDTPGEEIYYLGIIDCLTRYNLLKRAEHFYKGMGGHESQISPIPPDRYGDRFVKFISGITMSRERAEKERLSTTLAQTAGVQVPTGIEGTVDDPNLGGVNISNNVSPTTTSSGNPAGTAEVIRRAEQAAEKSKKKGVNEADIPDRSIMAVRSSGEEQGATTLPVIGEAVESGSNTSRTPRASPTNSVEDVSEKRPASSSAFPPRSSSYQPIIGNANMPANAVGKIPPPTPPTQNDGQVESVDATSWGGVAPPTPPKDAQTRPPSEKNSYGVVEEREKGDRFSSATAESTSTNARSEMISRSRRSFATTQLSASPDRLNDDDEPFGLAAAVEQAGRKAAAEAEVAER